MGAVLKKFVHHVILPMSDIEKETKPCLVIDIPLHRMLLCAIYLLNQNTKIQQEKPES